MLSARGRAPGASDRARASPTSEQQADRSRRAATTRGSRSAPGAPAAPCWRPAPSAARTRGGARRARQHQVRDIRARNQQHESHRAEQQPQRALGRRADDAIDQPIGQDAEGGVGRRMAGRRPAAMASSSARAEAIVADGASRPSTIGPSSPRRLVCSSGPNQSGCQSCTSAVGRAKLPGHDPDDLDGRVAESNRPADDPALAGESLLPQPWLMTTARGEATKSADSKVRPMSGAVPSSSKKPGPTRPTSMRAASWLAERVAGELRPNVGGHRLELPALGLPVAEVQVRRAVGKVLPDVLRPHDRDAIRLAVGQVAQDDRPQHAEDRGVGADPQRERQHRDRGEARRARQRAQAISKVLDERVHRGVVTNLPLDDAIGPSVGQPQRTGLPAQFHDGQ